MKVLSNTLIILLVLIGVTCAADDSLNITDGPYVFLEKTNPFIVTICENVFDTIGLKNSKQAGVEQLCSDSLLSVDVNLLVNYPNSAIDSASKLFVFSDIHGEYESLCSLLINNQLVTPELHWNFGDGHLVVNGDMTDRGDKVTEILWLIYRLEQEAVKAGGRVHYLLGNHEIMCLQEDLRYIHPKYHKVCSLLDKSYSELLGPNTVFGKWLGSKNVVEKIGDILFVHGGVSPELIEAGHDINSINSIIKQTLFIPKVERKKIDSLKILYGSFGPIWYRGLITDMKNYDRLTELEVDKILEYFDATQIVVGHCVLDSVSAYYNNKVLGVNIDYELFEEFEGLYWEAGQFEAWDVHGQHRVISNSPTN